MIRCFTTASIGALAGVLLLIGGAVFATASAHSVSPAAQRSGSVKVGQIGPSARGNAILRTPQAERRRSFRSHVAVQQLPRSSIAHERRGPISYDPKWCGPDGCRTLAAPGSDDFVSALVTAPTPRTRRVLRRYGLPAIDAVPPIVILNPDK